MQQVEEVQEVLSAVIGGANVGRCLTPDEVELAVSTIRIDLRS